MEFYLLGFAKVGEVEVDVQAGEDDLLQSLRGLPVEEPEADAEKPQRLRANN